MSYTTTGFLKRVMLLCAALALISCAPAAAPQPPTAAPQIPTPQSAAPQTATPPMSLAEAQQIASQSDCMQVGRTKNTGVYNPNSNTWWIDLDATARGCNPACVVDVATRTAEVNWRCTGAAVPPGSTPQSTGAQTANPASENCIKQGGTLTIQTRGDGGQYGVCLFEDNRQCEEWAMLRGDCPVGGIKVTGYVTTAAQYCAITGGTYTVTGNANTENETGTCTFKNGQTCDADAYYNGTCTVNTSTSPQPNPAGGGSVALAGNYIGQAPAADAPGQILVLTLVPDKTAALTNQFIGKGAPLVEAGTWSYAADGITVTLKNDPPMVFKYDNGTLILQNPTEAGYGPNGLTLTRTPSGNTNTAEYDGVKIAFDAELAQSAQGETLAAVPVSEGPALGGGSPAAIRFLFDGATAQDYFNPHLAQVLVYKAEDWTNLDPSTAATVTNLQTLLAAKPVSPTSPIPLLPPISASQVFYAQAQYLDFHNGTGVGFITTYKQDVSLITASQIFYTFQGLTNDGQYYVAAFYPISTTLLPAQDNMTGEEYNQFFQNYDSYLTTLTAQLNGLLAAGYVPDLRLVEDLMRSIEIGDTTLQ
jgi:putative hemolysin